MFMVTIHFCLYMMRIFDRSCHYYFIFVDTTGRYKVGWRGEWGSFKCWTWKWINPWEPKKPKPFW